MRGANLGLKFLLELAALAAFGYAGIWMFDGVLAILAAIVLPLAGALVWGRWNAPRSAHRLPRGRRIPLELAVLLLGAFALAGGGQIVLAVVLAVLIGLNAVLMTVFDQWEQ